MIQRWALLLLLIVFTPPGAASAQNAFPAPLPGANPPTILPNPPPADMPSSAASQANCANDYGALRDEAEKRGALIRAASARHAPVGESCKLIDEFMAAEAKMLDYVKAKSGECAIPANIMDQLKTSHEKTETVRERVCSSVDASQKRRPDGTQINDFGDPAFKR